MKNPFASGEGSETERTLPFRAKIALPGQDETVEPLTQATAPLAAPLAAPGAPASPPARDPLLDEPLGTLPFGTVLTGLPPLGDETTEPPSFAGAARHVAERLEPGAIVGTGFVVGERIGGDPYGERWSASHPEHGACYLLVLGEGLPDEVRQRLLIRSVLLQSYAPSPLLERPLDLDGLPRPWIAFPWRSVPTMSALLRQAPLEPRRVAELGLELARGLELIGERKRTHGDPHPDHVEVPPSGPPRWTGWARMAVVDEQGVRYAYRGGPALGDATYVPPELLGGMRPHPKAAVYALGGMLYQLLTGNPPYSGATPGEILQQAKTYEIPPPSAEEPKDMPGRLEALSRRMLAKDAHLRPTARELVVQFEAILAGRSLTQRREASPWPWLLAGVALLALIGLGLWFAFA